MITVNIDSLAIQTILKVSPPRWLRTALGSPYEASLSGWFCPLPYASKVLIARALDSRPFKGPQ